MKDTTELKILQYNVHKRLNAVQIPFLYDSQVQEFDIIAIQEQGRSLKAVETHNTRDINFHLVSHTNPNARACIYVNKKIDTKSWSIEMLEPDICCIRLSTRTSAGETHALRIYSVYNPCPYSTTSTEGPSTLPLLEQALQTEEEKLVVGDFNLHHPQWTGPNTFSRHAAADKLVDITVEKQLELLLPPGSITRDTHGQQTTIDLTFGSEWTASRTLYCGVRKDLHHGSDHLPVETTLSLRTTTVRQAKRRLWKELDHELLKATLKDTLPRPYKLYNRNEIDAYVSEIHNTIQKAIEKSVPWARPSQRAKIFWTPQCSEAVEQAKRRRNDWKALNTEATWRAYCEATDAKGKIIQKAKTAAFRKTMHEICTAENPMWKMAKWARTKSTVPKELPQFPPLKYTGDDGDTLARSFEEKAEILNAKFFPPPPQTSLEDIGSYAYPPAVAQNEDITQEEIKQAIRRPKADKAPGISQIPNRILQAGLTELLPSLTNLFNTCREFTYHPKAFKKANIIVLKKPRKADYTEAKAYRPIALLDTMGKALETIYANRLSNLAEEHNLLPKEHMGARRKRSTETALELLIDQVHTIWGCGKEYVATVLSLDVAGAFDNVSHERLIDNLKKRRIPEYIIHWTESFLKEREASLSFDGQTSPLRRISAGIPQGSPISPILFLFFNADLVEICDNLNLTATEVGFVDDINILAYGKSTQTNCNTLRYAHDECIKWARKHGVTFAPDKYELIHLSRTPRRFDMAKSLSIEGEEIAPTQSIKVLGVHIDSKLYWGPHMRSIEAKNATQSLALNRLGASTWGATFAKARQIYKTIVRPAITYSAPVWHQRSAGGKPASKEKKLEILQNNSLRNITGAFKRTSTETLEKETFIPPIHITLDELQDRTVLRHRETGRTHEIRRACNKIRAKLRPIRPRGGFPITPGERKDAKLDEAINKGRELLNAQTQIQIQQIHRRPDEPRPTVPPADRRAIAVYHRDQWEKRWESYRRRKPEYHRTPAQNERLTDKVLDLRTGLQKAESTLATQIRTERIGLNAYLASRRVPDFDSPECDCGWGHQTARHILIHCTKWVTQRTHMLSTAGTTDYRRLITTARGLKAAARMLMKTDLLKQFSLAKILLYGEV